MTVTTEGGVLASAVARDPVKGRRGPGWRASASRSALR